MPIEVEVDRGEVMGVFHFVENGEFAERTVFPSLARRLTATGAGVRFGWTGLRWCVHHPHLALFRTSMQ